MNQSKHSKPQHKLSRRCRGLLAATVIAFAPAPVVYAEDLTQISDFVDLMQNFYGLMDAMYAAASNPEHAALLQMNSLEDLYKETGDQRQMVEVYRGVIEHSENPTVRRLAQMRLADTLKETGQMKEAISVLRSAIDESVRQANQN